MATRLYIGDSSKTPAIVKVEEVAKTKFGASVDTWIGSVDENGVLSESTAETVLDFTGIKEIGKYALFCSFAHTNVIGVDLSSLETVDGYGLENAFQFCDSLTSIDLSSLKTVGNYGLSHAFERCDSLTSIDLSSLKTVGNYGLSRAFNCCSSLPSIDLSSLKTVGDDGLNNAFQLCGSLTSIDLSSLETVGRYGLETAFQYAGITTISFPSLTDIQSNSFGSSSSGVAFRGCTELTEIHFRADMQATIETMSQYANKWGATNATIYFDL